MTERFRARQGDFSPETKALVRSRGVCADCGEGPVKEDPWEVHHIIYLCSEVGKNMPFAILQSLENSELFHSSCHRSFHYWYAEPPREDVERVLNAYATRKKKTG